jgi:hypothetical protein
MRPIMENEVLMLPESGEHTCPQCGLWARGAHDIDRVFGFRRHNYAPRKDGTIRVDVMPWCKPCRRYPDKGADAREIENAADFDVVRGKFPGVVYLIFAHDMGMCKIGYSQAHPAGRLRDFQCGSPVELSLVGFYGSDYFGETEAHHHHHDRRVRGEWFEMNAIEAGEWVRANGGVTLADLRGAA